MWQRVAVGLAAAVLLRATLASGEPTATPGPASQPGLALETITVPGCRRTMPANVLTCGRCLVRVQVRPLRILLRVRIVRCLCV
jgi:hypothetical protein